MFESEHALIHQDFDTLGVDLEGIVEFLGGIFVLVLLVKSDAKIIEHLGLVGMMNQQPPEGRLSGDPVLPLKLLPAFKELAILRWEESQDLGIRHAHLRL